MLEAAQMGMSKLQPKIKLKPPRLHFGAASDRPETIEIPKFPAILEVVWQQPTETIIDQVNLNKTNNDSIIHYTQERRQKQAKRPYLRDLNHRTT